MADRNEMIQALAVTTELTGTDLSQGARKAMVAELEQYNPDDVIHALDRCRRELRGRMALADIIERMPNQWLGAEEAWARIPKTENASGFMYEEMGRAWSAAQPLYDEGDTVAARMAFKEAYQRELAQAKAEGRQPNWFFSPGWDPQERQAEIERAKAEGLITNQRAQALLQHHSPQTEPDPTIKQIANASAAGDAETAEKCIQEMRDALRVRKTA